MTASRIHRLTLTHFRNYRAAALRRAATWWCWSGRTAPARPICLEAISFLSPGRGLRRATLDDVADIQGDGSWAVSAEVEGALGLATLGTGIDPPGSEGAATSRRCRIDREPVGSATAFGDHLRMVWLTPAMDGLFIGRGLGAAAVLRPAGAGDRQRAFQPGLGARPLLALAQPAAGGAQLRRPLVRRDRARDRRARGRGGGDARPDRDAAGRDAARARRRPRRFPPRRSCSTAGWRTRCSASPPPRSRIATARSCATAAPATPPPAAPSTARISPICR